jgi:hypothetical protein
VAVKITPNLGPTYRVLYAVFGAVLVAAPFVAVVPTWVRIVVPILGVLSIASAAVGW